MNSVAIMAWYLTFVGVHPATHAVASVPLPSASPVTSMLPLIASNPAPAPVAVSNPQRTEHTPSTADAIAAVLSDPPVKVASASSTKTAATPEEQLCSVNMSDQDIRYVLELLTKQSKLNILLESTAPVKITLHVENMRLIDVMRHICALSGLAYLKVSGAYVVGTADALKTSYAAEWNLAHPAPAPPPPPAPAVVKPEAPLVTETFAANYVHASQLADSIKKLIPKGLDVIAGPAQESPNLSNLDPSDKTGTGSVTVTTESGVGATSSRLLILRGSKENVAAALDIAKQLDVPRAQVSIACTVHDISDDAVRDLGLGWTFTDLILNETPAGNGISVGKITRSPMTFDATIAALETKDVARLLASPNISLLDGEKAFILIGDRINYPVLTGYSANNQPIFSVNTERVGVYLQVAANISSDGYITISLYPQVSSITGYLNVNGASYPQVSTREAQTTLRVKSGETIVLGGLLQDTDIVSDSNVPILSQLPFIGSLFKHRTKTRNKEQVIVTLRPIITTPTK